MAEAGPQGHPGHPGHPVPSPRQVLCQQRWRGLTLPSSGCFCPAAAALSPLLRPCPRSVLAAAQGPQHSPPPPHTWNAKASLPITEIGPRKDPPGFVPQEIGLSRLGAAGRLSPAAWGGSGEFGGAVGCCREELRCTGMRVERGTAKCSASAGCRSCLCGEHGPETPTGSGRTLPLQCLQRTGTSQTFPR